MASTSSSSPTTGGPSPLANIITQVPQSTNTFASSAAAARPVKIKKKKQQDSNPNKPRKSTTTTTAITTPSVAPTTDTTAQNAATTTPLTPAEAAAQAAANMQAKQQQQQQALAPPRTTSKQQPRKPSSTTATAATRSPSASTTTATAAAPTTTTATPAATSTPTAAPTPAPPTTRSQAYTTTAPKEKSATPKPSLTPAEAAAKAKSTTTTQNKPKFMRRFIAIITCSSPSHMVSPSDDSARTLTGGNASSSTKKSYEAGTASTLDGPAPTAKSPATAAAPATAPKEITEKSTLKPPSAALQPPTTPTKSSTLSVPATNGHLTPSSSSSSALLASTAGANAPPSPSPSTIAGGTRLPREETGDVTSGAVVPPGASYVHSGTAGPGNMFRLASAVDGVPSLGIIAAVAGTGKDEAGLGVPITPGATPRQSLLATPEVAAAAAAATASAAAGGSEQSEEMETEDEDEMDDEEDEDDGAHLDEDEYELSEEALEEQRLIAQGGNGIPVDEDGNPQPLLSPIIEKDSGRKCLVLDLDETLVHSSFKMIHNADFIVPVEIEGHSHSVYVIKRPGVDEFMRRMGELYEVVVFTASLSKYADPVLDMLDIHRVVRHRLFRESCFNHKGNYVKDLSQLGRPIGETLILDNSPASYIFHPNNAVPISSWFNDPHDTELVDLCEFLRDLSVVDDVRTVLDGAL
ncbi:hypothetical protein CF327_g5385 [Tilletia walkeri]|uniref:FCP1 homology domain-containing protein n=1 Tax=Tilletia walkeri TaxID=117179 RepID=A0A8X7NF35_9BASI|nr:hypothetical protein CF327_g5385 [Tilletia walkeri]KAE8271898.1 hypothetical protein A4X09_0g421 [Tilletia walkeri]